MDIEKLLEKVREAIIGEIKEEFREFRATVSGQLEGFRLAIESINARMTNLEEEVRDIRRSLDETNKRIDETNKRIDELRVELKAEITANTLRIDETNKRIDETNKRIDETNDRIDKLFLEVSKIRGDLNRALSQKEVFDDVLLRVQRLEARVLEAA